MMPGNPEAIAQQFQGEEKKADQVLQHFKEKCIEIGVIYFQYQQNFPISY